MRRFWSFSRSAGKARLVLRSHCTSRSSVSASATSPMRSSCPLLLAIHPDTCRLPHADEKTAGQQVSPIHILRRLRDPNRTDALLTAVGRKPRPSGDRRAPAGLATGPDPRACSCQHFRSRPLNSLRMPASPDPRSRRERAGRASHSPFGMAALRRITARLNALRAASALGKPSMAASCS